ncbi:cation-translocating P-type ATPase C-terminal domain-containing protein [Singulisphaera sp. GP187]|uniref:cation transporting ATPase C-terminal domain-containing protein n=1 Tax=Singulisphaera sp. GP187 TaxID=1882752 RepID=UPI0009408E6A
MLVSVMQGLSVLSVVLAVFAIALYRGQGEHDARALTFTTLIVANLGLILANRSWSRTLLENLRIPKPAMWWVYGGATVFLFAVLFIPFLRDLFHFSILHPNDLLLCLATGVVSLLWFERVEIRATSGTFSRSGLIVSTPSAKADGFLGDACRCYVTAHWPAPGQPAREGWGSLRGRLPTVHRVEEVDPRFLHGWLRRSHRNEQQCS